MPPDNPASNGHILESWSHALVEIPLDGLETEAVATVEERTNLAKSLGVSSCDAVSASYTLVAVKPEQIRLSGTLVARITQECVVTLEPLQSTISEKLDAIFMRPAAIGPTPADGDLKILTDVSIEPIDGNTISVGAFCYETLASAIDPYPRARDNLASGEPINVSSRPDNADDGPFAQLKKFRNRGGDTGQ